MEDIDGHPSFHDRRMQPAIERHVAEWLWDPVVLTILTTPAWLVLGLWFVLQWAYSSGYAVSGAGDVAYLAHVAGFVVGALIALPLRGKRVPPRPPRQRYVNAR